MQISPPFLPNISHASDDTYLDACMRAPSDEGNFPLAGHFCWHKGIHLLANSATGSGQAGPGQIVCAIAEGTVKFVRTPATKNGVADNPLNYNPFAEKAAWTDTGFVILEHTLQLDANGKKFRFYSAYMHLAKLDNQLPAVGTKIKRRTQLGTAGQIYGSLPQIHFEICCDGSNLANLMDRKPDDTLPDPPNKNGQTDFVFGHTLVYLPGGTPISREMPTVHTRSGTDAGGSAFIVENLGHPVWVEIAYERGGCTLKTIDQAKRTPIGTVHEALGEYRLFAEAKVRHTSLKLAQNNSSVEGWYQLLRFGRVLGTAKLPPDVRHWRKIATAKGQVWADLNAGGTYKFSGADFIPALGWRFIQDDLKHQDQRCQSRELKVLISSAEPAVNLGIIKDKDVADLLMQRVHTDVGGLKRRLRRAVCMFATEWAKESIEERCAWIKDDPGFKENPDNWKKLLAHLNALACSDLPAEYVGATWNWHPVEFIRLLRSLTVNKDIVKLWDEARNDKVLPNDGTLTDLGKTALYEYALRSSAAAVTSDTDAEAFSALEELDKVSDPVGTIVGLRREVDINFNSGHGGYTDRILVLKRTDGYVVELLYRGKYTSQPSGRYLEGGTSAYDEKREGKVVSGFSNYKAIGRLKANRTYQYKLDHRTGYGDNLPNTNFNILKRATSTSLERLVTPPNSTPGGPQSAWMYGGSQQFNDDRSIYFHRGYNSETGSAGCQTFPASGSPGEQFSDFMAKLKPYSSATVYPYALMQM
jgi:hypothetical protein